MPRAGADRLLDEKGRVVAAAAFWPKVVPGRYLAFFYPDDPGVWHQGLICWVGHGAGKPVALFTPDGDCYV